MLGVSLAMAGLGAGRARGVRLSRGVLLFRLERGYATDFRRPNLVKRLERGWLSTFAWGMLAAQVRDLRNSGRGKRASKKAIRIIVNSKQFFVRS